ncbi:MAG: hypothetical protein K2R93_05910 [Gemmatimonadaceae bacterium]|nr:hypothetical protein [Gemmatimonadaceae bacterium]
MVSAPRTLVLAVCALSSSVLGCARPAAPPAPPTALHIEGFDYAFTAPDTVPAGPAVVTFENRGKHRHEMVFVRLKDGLSLREVADSLTKGARTNALRSSGSAVLFAEAGQRNEVVSLRLQFAEGEHWAIVCQFADSAGAPKHNTLGMFKLVTVQ